MVMLSRHIKMKNDIYEINVDLNKESKIGINTVELIFFVN